MSVLGLRVGPFEIERPARVPLPGDWYVARRVGISRKQPAEVLVRILPDDAPAEARAALQRGFEILRSLDDPRVPAPIAFYEGSGALAIDLVDGSALSELVAARKAGDV